MSVEISTANDFFLGANGTEIAPMLPVRIASREQAYRTAVWIELMGSVLPSETGASMDNGPTFDDIRTAILNT